MDFVKGFAFLALPLIAVLFVQDASAVPVELEDVKFDFDGAPYRGGAAEIEAYMEGLYPSYDITVVGGIVGNGCFGGPLGQDEGKDHDHYIQAGPSCGTYWFSFSFGIPITSVSFDWGVRFNAFHAFADDVEIFSSDGWKFWTWGNSGIINLLEVNPNGVTTLRFSDSFLGEIEVDNLVVTPTPEPATVALLGLGGLVLVRKRRAWAESGVDKC